MKGLYGDMLERIEAVPAIRTAGGWQPALLAGSSNSTSIYVQGRVYPPSRDQIDNGINRLVISLNFFEVMGIPMVLGRGFTERDNATGPKVVVINEAAARKYFPGEN